MRKQQRFTYGQAYKEYKEIAGKSALTKEEWGKIIPSFFYKLNRTIIVDAYEWKVPFGGGFIRIIKDEKGYFKWYWDRRGDYCRLKKKKFWAFRPVVGWVDKLIGQRGLVHHYFACKNDPFKEDYDVPRVFHR